MATKATMKLVVLFESEMKAIAAAIQRYNELCTKKERNNEEIMEAVVDVLKSAHVAFATINPSDDAAWVLCNHDAIRAVPVATTTQPPDGAKPA